MYMCIYTGCIGICIYCLLLLLYPPTLSASRVLDNLCHPASTHHQSKAARQQGSQSLAARQQGSKAAREKGSMAGQAAKAGKAGKAARQQGSKAAKQQPSKTARQLIHGSKI